MPLHQIKSSLYAKVKAGDGAAEYLISDIHSSKHLRK